VGSGTGGFHLENPGNTSFGTGTELRIQAPTGGSVNKFSIYDFTNTGPYVTVKMKAYISASSSQTGEQQFFIGNGTNFSDNNTFISSQMLTGFQMLLNADNTVTVNYRSSSGWSPLGILLKQESYLIEVFGNNDLAATAAVNYSRCGTTYSVGAGKIDVWVNGTQVGDELNKGALPAGTSPNAFMAVSLNASSPAFSAILDDITYSGSLISTAAVTASISSSNPGTVGGSDGTATVSVTSGTAPYTYSWTPSGGTAATATGLSAGTYTATITDANGCQTAQSVTLTDPAASPLNVMITSQTNASCFGASDGSVTVEASGGTPPYSYAWTNGGGTSATASNLVAGTYTVTVTDDASATATQAVTITEPAALTVSASAGQSICAGASATLTATGATSYMWSNGMTGASISVSPSSTTTYTVTGTTSGCSATANTTVTVNPEPTATAGSNSPVTTGGTIMLSATGGNTYTWSGPNGFSSYIQNPQITNAVAANAGIYTVSVVSNNCSAMATTSVSVTASSGSTVFTIDQTQPASATNFTSFTSAAAYLNSSGVSTATQIDVVSGTGPYNEQLLLNTIPGSSAVNTVTINGNGNVLSLCSNNSTIRDVVRLNGTDNISI
ncbi:MAG: hypothetical protein EOP49_26490, partial [Sphingobacteriales bacterium]